MSKTVVIGLLGFTLDNAGFGPNRWERWRPTISLCQHEDLFIDRLELLYQKEFKGLLNHTCKDIKSVSPETEIVTHEISLKNPWDFENVFALLHDFSLKYQFNQDDDYLVHISTGTHVAQICLFLLTEARYFPARLIQSGPGRGRSSRSTGTFSIIDLDLSQYDRLASRFNKEREDDISFLKSGIKTRNPSFNRLIEQIGKVTIHSPDPILLAGPTGSGKSKLAKRIFELKKSRRRIEGDFVEVNCATLRKENAMSALFGHTKGAFTGASCERAGLLKAADKGLLFLDEVGELGSDEQAMLLRAIEEKKFSPLGADLEVASDFQLICGSNCNLQKECNKGAFREDLLARISLWTFELPGLCDRPEDFEPNFDYELERFSSRTGNRVTINKEAKQLFLDFALSSRAQWTANFRDLCGAVTRMATLATNGRITIGEVQEEIKCLKSRWELTSKNENSSRSLTATIGKEKIEQLDVFDQVTLEKVVEICRSSTTIADAGRTLFNRSRLKKSTVNDSDRLRKYLAKFGLNWNQIVR